jgi:hypothetical protein
MTDPPTGGFTNEDLGTSTGSTGTDGDVSGSSNCGNGSCDKSDDEDCRNCPQDCQCTGDKECNGNISSGPCVNASHEDNQACVEKKGDPCSCKPMESKATPSCSFYECIGQETQCDGTEDYAQRCGFNVCKSFLDTINGQGPTKDLNCKNNGIFKAFAGSVMACLQLRLAAVTCRKTDICPEGCNENHCCETVQIFAVAQHADCFKTPSNYVEDGYAGLCELDLKLAADREAMYCFLISAIGGNASSDCACELIRQQLNVCGFGGLAAGIAESLCKKLNPSFEDFIDWIK